MDSALILKIILFSLIPLGCMIAGGVLGTFFQIRPKMRSMILHLAAGVVFAVVAVELLPAILEKKIITPVIIGFVIGFVLMLIIRFFTRKSEKKHTQEISKETMAVKAAQILPWGLLVGIGVDILLDGFLIGLGFAAGKTEGILLCVALSIEILALGLVVAAELSKEKFKKRTSLYTIIILAISIVIGAFLGAILVNVINGDTLLAFLAFGVSALLYLITEELLLEAHEEPDTVIASAIFFIGFLIFLVIGMME